MKNKKKVILILLLLLIMTIISVILYKYYTETTNNYNQKEYTFDTNYGTVKIEADKALSARGTAGATNNIFYLKDNNLYLYSEKSTNELYAKNIDDIYYAEEQGDQITVVTNKDTVIIKESAYLKYLPIPQEEEEELTEFNFETAYGSVTIRADKALSARGTAGATNNIFYIKNNNLYYYVHEGEDELYAENVDDIYYAEEQGEQITVVTNTDTVIIKESAYLKYLTISQEEEDLTEFNFDTAYGAVTIKADKALSARGTAGASNYIFYLKNGNLYLYSENNINELYAENIDDIYYAEGQGEQITVVTNTDTVIIKESAYLKYLTISQEEEELTEFNFDTAYGSVTIKATYALTCRGYAGATNNIFYIKNNNLYYYVHDGEDELYAENIEKMYYETSQAEVITISTSQFTNILKTHNCLLYN